MNSEALGEDMRSWIMAALGGVIDSASGRDVVSAGMVSAVHISGKGEAIITLSVDPGMGNQLEPLRQQVENIAAGVQGVSKATAILTAEKSPAAPPRAADPHGMDKSPRLNVPVKNIVLISSGKGGVGKSTFSINLAYALSNYSQLKIGLLDADIYGPSIPKLTGLEGCKPDFSPARKIIPPTVRVENSRIKVMSIGFMVDANKALVWRGPMVQTALYQLFRDVEWATPEDLLDILIVDMPPGTGDAQLTIAQKIPVTGAVIVSTPQDIALIDARKAVEMYRATGVPILGIIENMSTHICTNCGHEEPIFGHGGAKAEAERLGVPFLGEIPLSRAIREAADAGAPQGLDAVIIDRFMSALSDPA